MSVPKREVTIDNIDYSSIGDASKQLNIPYATIQGRMASSKYPGWFFKDGKPALTRRTVKKNTKIPGVYTIKSLRSGKFYIGSTTGLTQRKGTHFHQLRKGTHNNPNLQREWDDSGGDRDNFEFTAYVTNDIMEARKLEQQWFGRWFGDENCLNISKDVSSPIHGIDGARVAPKRNPEERAKWLEEQKQKVMNYTDNNDSRNSIADRGAWAKPVIIEGVRYPTLTAALYFTGINTSSIRKRCNSTRKQYNGYRWGKRRKHLECEGLRPATDEDYLPNGLINGEERRKIKRCKGLMVVTHVKSGKVYVGCSINVYRVINEEEKRLERNSHRNREMQALFNNHPKVEVSVIELDDDCDPSEEKVKKIEELGPDVCVNYNTRNSSSMTSYSVS